MVLEVILGDCGGGICCVVVIGGGMVECGLVWLSMVGVLGIFGLLIWLSCFCCGMLFICWGEWGFVLLFFLGLILDIFGDCCRFGFEDM